MSQTLRYLLAGIIFLGACVFCLRYVPEPFHVWAVLILVVLVACFVITWLLRGTPPTISMIALVGSMLLAGTLACGEKAGNGNGNDPTPAPEPTKVAGGCEAVGPGVYAGTCAETADCVKMADGRFSGTGTGCHAR